MATRPLTQLRELTHQHSQSGQSVRLHSISEACAPHFHAQWQALANQASEPNPFFEPWFLLPSLQQFGLDANVSLFCVLHEGVLVGLMPLERSKRYYKYPIPHFVGWNHANMFCGAPLVAKGFEQQFWAALLDHCDQTSGTELFLHLPSLPTHGPLARTLAHTAAEQGRKSAVVQSHDRAFLHSDLTSEDYFAGSLSTKKRKELRRQHRRLAELGELSFARETGVAGTPKWAQEFLALEQAGWKGEQGSALAEDGATHTLFETALSGAAEADRLERLALYLDGKPIAMLANFITAPGSFSFKTAFDEEYARYSPGVLLQQENLTLLERDDIDWCDSCAAQGHPMIERIWREKRSIASISVAVGGNMRRTLFSQLLRAESHEPFEGTEL